MNDTESSVEEKERGGEGVYVASDGVWCGAKFAS